jgi:hypothetical protein
MHRAEISIANPIPRVSEAAQLGFTIQTMAGNGFHLVRCGGLALVVISAGAVNFVLRYLLMAIANSRVAM